MFAQLLWFLLVWFLLGLLTLMPLCRALRYLRTEGEGSRNEVPVKPRRPRLAGALATAFLRRRPQGF